VTVERSARRLSAARIVRIAERLLDASTLCAISTVSTRDRAHINTVYFAWNRRFHVIWLSDPKSLHARHLRANSSVAVAVYDSRQTWGGADQGIQLFGSAREATGRALRDAEELYAGRFPGYREEDFGGYRFYLFRSRRIKLFDERALGTGIFVTADVATDGGVAWRRTERVRSTERRRASQPVSRRS
jgi:uncharacterized protein YhbP (UPF0306 family)